MQMENKNETACIEIIGLVPNSSNFTKSGINKITITKKQILESGAVDLIDVLKSVPDINITQSGPKRPASIYVYEGNWVKSYIGNDKWNSH